ncbi:hypothetical protein ACTOV4_00630 [Brucella sp. C7-11G]
MDKLTVINNALIATGNSTVNILHDSSDEYRVADNAFDRAIKFLTARHSWPFATTIEPLVRAPDSENVSRQFPENGFRLPTNAFHLKEVFYHQVPLTEYEIMGGILSCRYEDSVFAKVVRTPDTALWHPMAEEILTLMVEAGCQRSLNEDTREATNIDNRVEGLIMEARPHLDQQNPARNIYKSKVARARRMRRG